MTRAFFAGTNFRAAPSPQGHVLLPVEGEVSHNWVPDVGHDRDTKHCGSCSALLVL